MLMKLLFCVQTTCEVFIYNLYKISQYNDNNIKIDDTRRVCLNIALISQ